MYNMCVNGHYFCSLQACNNQECPIIPSFQFRLHICSGFVAQKGWCSSATTKKMTTKNGSKLKKQICESSSMTLKKVVREAKSSFLLNEANLIDERHTSFPHTIFQCVKQSTLTILSTLNWT